MSTEESKMGVMFSKVKAIIPCRNGSSWKELHGSLEGKCKPVTQHS